MHSAPRDVLVFVASFGSNYFPISGQVQQTSCRYDLRLEMGCRVRGKDVDWLIDGKIRWALGRKDVLN